MHVENFKTKKMNVNVNSVIGYHGNEYVRTDRHTNIKKSTTISSH